MDQKYFKGLMLGLVIILSCSCTVSEKLLIGGCGWDKVAIVDKKSNAIEWIHQLQKGDDCNDVEITKAGNVLYAYKGGARLITRNQDVIWDFKVEKGQELYTATELPSGEYLLAVCAIPSRIITLNSKGEKIKEQNFDSGITNVHGQFRQILPTRENTYLIPLMGKGEVIELTQTGEVIRRVTVGGNPFSVKLLPDGNWLVACGDAHKLVVVDSEKQAVKQTIAAEDVSNVALLFVAEMNNYPNGNVLISNWNGHSKDKNQPKLIELDSKNQVVWTLAPNDEIKNISAVYSFRKKK
jgi:hypothetical protein